MKHYKYIYKLDSTAFFIISYLSHIDEHFVAFFCFLKHLTLEYYQYDIYIILKLSPFF